MSFQEELTDLINSYSIDSQSDTPDFVLADYLIHCLETYRVTIQSRDMWYEFGRHEDTPDKVPQKPQAPELDIICESCGRKTGECKCAFYFRYGLMLLVGLGAATVFIAEIICN